MGLLTLMRRRGPTPPSFWLNTALTHRLPVSVTNSSGGDLYDHLVSVTVPVGVTVDSASLRAVETTTLGGIDHAYDWRYGSGAASLNRLPFLPVSLSGGVATVKVLGRWTNGEARTFHLYWSSSSSPTPPTVSHLDVVAAGWTATITAGTAGDTYTLVVGGTSYTYVMVGGDTATVIATALKNAINGGSIATATNSSGVITITTTTPRTPFTLTNAGSTVAGNVVIVKPQYLIVARVGPDTEAAPANATYQLGLPSYGTGTAAFLALGQVANTARFLRLFRYKASGDGTYYGAQDATISSISVDGPTITVTGTITFSTRAAGVDWSGAFTAVYHNRIAALQKTDQTGNAHAMNKAVDLCHLTVTYTCQRAHTPPASAADGSGFAFYAPLELQSLGNFSGNVTTVAGEQLPYFYATGASATGYTASTTPLNSTAVNGTIMGQAGNNFAMAFSVVSAALAGFTGQSAAILRWYNNTNSLLLQVAGLSTGATIPVNATITLDLWYGEAVTQNGTATGDNLTPDELVALLRSVVVAPVATAGTLERFSTNGLSRTLSSVGTQAVTAAGWFQAQALSKTGLAGNYAFQWDLQNLTVAPPDDDDGNYGQGHLLHGLCLRYLRLHDPALVALIESQVQFHLDIEAAAVSAYGAYWSGSAPYWYWPKVAASGAAYTAEGGVSGGLTAAIDPTYDSGGGAGLSLGTISYTQGQVRRLTSIDQMHMVGHGLFAYLFLLRNEAAITANTTLRTNTLAYLSRMQTFEAAHWPAQDRVLDNLYPICNTGSLTAGAHANGITATKLNTQANTDLANPFRGDEFPAWQDANGDSILMNASANSSIDYFFRAIWASDSVQSGLVRFMQGRCYDICAMDLGRHDVLTTQTTWGVASTLAGTYPPGWQGRAQATSNVWRYGAGRATDKHYVQLAAGGTGARDMAGGRLAQRAVILALTALLDPATVISVEMAGASVLRSADILTALNDVMRVLAVYGSEPTTGAQRFAMSAFYGGSGSQVVDSAFTGYWMMAVELWYLVQARVAGTFSPADYYRFAGV